MKIFRSILKVLGVAALQMAPAAVAGVGPWATPILQMMLNSIFSAEKLMGDGTGEAKRNIVTMSLAAADPMIDAMLAAQGKRVANEELFAAGIAKMREGLVDLLNSTESLSEKR